MTLAAEDWGPWSTTPSQRLQSLARIRARRNGQPVAIAGGRHSSPIRPSARFGTDPPAAGSKLGPIAFDASVRAGLSGKIAHGPPGRCSPRREHRNGVPVVRAPRPAAPAYQSLDSNSHGRPNHVPRAAQQPVTGLAGRLYV